MDSEITAIETSSLDRFKSLTPAQWWDIYGRQGSWYKTIDHEKYAETINNLVLVKHAADWAIGRFVVELQRQIQAEFEIWDKQYYKDPEKKPEYTSAEAWFDDHGDKMRLSWRQAKRHRWVYLNVDFEFSDLGYKKNKTIADFLGDDKETRRKFSSLVKQRKLNEGEVERSLELFISGLEDEAREIGMNKRAFQEEMTEKVLKKIGTVIDRKLKDDIKISIIRKGKDNIIRASSVTEGDRVNRVLIDILPQIKLKALKYE